MAKGLAGMPASPGIVDGPVHLLRWEVPDVRHRIIPDEAIAGEVERFHASREQAKKRLHQVRARAEKHAGPEEAAIFDVQLSILEDGELVRQVEELIHQNLLMQTQTRGTLGNLGSNISFPSSPTGLGTPGVGLAAPVPR